MAKPTVADLAARAQRAIDREEELCFDVCAESGQIFANVKRMAWFKRAVAQHIKDNFARYAHLPDVSR